VSSVKRDLELTTTLPRLHTVPRRDVSPTTQMPLPHKMLTPNAVLRAGLIDLLRQHC
jgi:hypothetical protein